jgi:hypothetical protein
MFVLPSISKNKIPYTSLCRTDWYLIFVLILLPTNLLGFLPAKLLYVPGFIDYRLLTLLCSFPLFFMGPKVRNKDFLDIPGIIALCLVCLLVVSNTTWSLVSGITFFDVIASLRWNFTWPIYSVCVLRYLSRLPVDRLYSVLRIILILFSIQVILLTGSLLTGIDFFLNKNSLSKSMQYIEQGYDVDNLKAFPLYIFTGTAFLFIELIRSNEWRMYHIIFFLSLALPILLTRRMYSIVLLTEIAVIFVLSNFVKKNVRAYLVYPFVIFCIISVVFLTRPDRIYRWLDKITPIFEDTVNPENVGTYSFRQTLLDHAINSVSDNDRPLFGMGYLPDNDSTRRYGYSYVKGEDSFVAPVIFCEGWGGLFLRLLPYAFLFNHNIKRLLTSLDLNVKMFSIMSIGIMLAQIPAYLQTSIFCHYEYFYVPLILVELIIIKRKKEMTNQILFKCVNPFQRYLR